MNATTIGLDIAKTCFQVHGVDAQGKTALQKPLRRTQVLGYFANMSPCLIGIEACASAHHWARELPNGRARSNPCALRARYGGRVQVVHS
jgi:transposase